MAKVIDLTPVTRQLRGKGGPPDNTDMEQRVTQLEALADKTGERLAALDRGLAVIGSNYATREDVAALRGEMKAAVAEAKNSIILWVVAAVFLAQLLPVVAGMVKHYFP